MNLTEKFYNDAFRSNYSEAIAAKNAGNFTEAKQKFYAAADYLEKLSDVGDEEKKAERKNNAKRLRAVADAISYGNRGICDVYEENTAQSLYPVGNAPDENGGEMRQFFTFYKPEDLRGFESVIGLEAAKQAVTEYVINPVLYPEAYNYDFLDNKAILLEGPPGTGKTTFAKAVAREINQPFALVNVASIVNCYVGETGKNIDKIFAFLRDYAQKNNCGVTVFFDELDEIAKSRGSDDKASEAAVPALLRNLDGVKSNKSFLVLANTNRKDVLDSAITERFRKQIYIPLPDEQMRKQLFDIKLAEIESEYLSKLDTENAARISEGLSGRDITYICDDLKYRIGKVKAGKAEEEEISVHFNELINERIKTK